MNDIVLPVMLVHLTDFLGKQVAGLVTSLIDTKKGPTAVGMPVAPWACAIKYLQTHQEIGLFWAVFSLKSHYVALCSVMWRCVAGMGIVLLCVNNLSV